MSINLSIIPHGDARRDSEDERLRNVSIGVGFPWGRRAAAFMPSPFSFTHFEI